MWEKTVSIHSILWGKLQCFSHMIYPYLYLLVILIFNQLNISKIKLINKILEKNIKKHKQNHMEKNTVAIHSNLRGKLQCFPHIL